jgi:hypothetical protein
VDGAFALLHELLDEMAQAEFFGVGLSHEGMSNQRGVRGDLIGAARAGPERLGLA